MNELLCVTAWFLAGLVNGISGMGAAMVALPFLSIFMSPQEFVPVACIVVTVISAHMAWNYRYACKVSTIKALFIGTIPGSFVGLGLLIFIAPRLLQFIIGIVLLLFVVWQFNKKVSQIKNKETLGKGILAGFCAGVMTTAISFGNPPVGIYTLHLGWGHHESVGTMNMFSTGAYAIACIIQAMGGLYHIEVLQYAALGIPAAIFGILCSIPIARRINAQLFRNILLFVLVISGCVCIIRAL